MPDCFHNCLTHFIVILSSTVIYEIFCNTELAANHHWWIKMVRVVDWIVLNRCQTGTKKQPLYI